MHKGGLESVSGFGCVRVYDRFRYFLVLAQSNRRVMLPQGSQDEPKSILLILNFCSLAPRFPARLFQRVATRHISMVVCFVTTRFMLMFVLWVMLRELVLDGWGGEYSSLNAETD